MHVYHLLRKAKLLAVRGAHRRLPAAGTVFDDLVLSRWYWVQSSTEWKESLVLVERKQKV